MRLPVNNCWSEIECTTYRGRHLSNESNVGIIFNSKIANVAILCCCNTGNCSLVIKIYIRLLRTGLYKSWDLECATIGITTLCLSSTNDHGCYFNFILIENHKGLNLPWIKNETTAACIGVIHMDRNNQEHLFMVIRWIKGNCIAKTFNVKGISKNTAYFPWLQKMREKHKKTFVWTL